MNITQKQDLLQSFIDDFYKFSDYIDKMCDKEDLVFLQEELFEKNTELKVKKEELEECGDDYLSFENKYDSLRRVTMRLITFIQKTTTVEIQDISFFDKTEIETLKELKII